MFDFQALIDNSSHHLRGGDFLPNMVKDYISMGKSMADFPKVMKGLMRDRELLGLRVPQIGDAVDDVVRRSVAERRSRREVVPVRTFGIGRIEALFRVVNIIRIIENRDLT